MSLGYDKYCYPVEFEKPQCIETGLVEGGQPQEGRGGCIWLYMQPGCNGREGKGWDQKIDLTVPGE